MKKALNFILPAILLGCAAMLVFTGVRSFIKVVGDQGQRLAVPGSTTVEISKPGVYDLWNHVTTVQQGTYRKFPNEIPEGTRVSIVNLRDGSAVEWRPNVGMTQVSGQSRRISFGAATFKEAGKYAVEIAGVPDEGRVFSIEEAKFPGTFLSAMLGLMGGIFLGIGAAIWLGAALIFVLVKKAMARPPAATAPPYR